MVIMPSALAESERREPALEAAGGRLALRLGRAAADLPAPGAKLRVADQQTALGRVLHQSVRGLTLWSTLGRCANSPAGPRQRGRPRAGRYASRPRARVCPLPISSLEDATTRLLHDLPQVIEVQPDMVHDPVQFDLIANPRRSVDIGDLLVRLGQIDLPKPSAFIRRDYGLVVAAGGPHIAMFLSLVVEVHNPELLVGLVRALP